jgi:hypothetical protein
MESKGRAMNDDVCEGTAVKGDVAAEELTTAEVGVELMIVARLVTLVCEAVALVTET